MLAQLIEVYVDCGHRLRFSYGELRSGNDAGLPIKPSIGPLLQQRRFAEARANAYVQPVRPRTRDLSLLSRVKALCSSVIPIGRTTASMASERGS